MNLNDKLQSIWKEQVVIDWSSYSTICLEGWWKTTNFTRCAGHWFGP